MCRNCVEMLHDDLLNDGIVIICRPVCNKCTVLCMYGFEQEKRSDFWQSTATEDTGHSGAKINDYKHVMSMRGRI